MNKILIQKKQEGIYTIFINEFNDIIKISCEKDNHSSFEIGDIFLAQIKKVEKSLSCAFIKYIPNSNRDGFLPIKTILPAFMDKDNEVILNAKIPVKMTRGTRGSKGALFAANFSICGNYSIFTPNEINAKHQISRKITGEKRVKLENILNTIPSNYGKIVLRTRCSTAAETEVAAEVNQVINEWRNNLAKVTSIGLIQKKRNFFTTIIDYIDKITNIQILVSDRDIYEQLVSTYPLYRDKSEVIFQQEDLLKQNKIDELLQSLSSKVVRLQSGGSLFIEKTEAVTTIDINSAKSTSFKDNEEMAVNINKEAMTEIACQIRLRNISGLIIIDCIHVKSQDSIEDIEQQLYKELNKDLAKIAVSGMSELGVIQLSRQFTGTELQSKSHKCLRCAGAGIEPSAKLIWDKVYLDIKRRTANFTLSNYILYISEELMQFLLEQSLYTFIVNKIPVLTNVKFSIAQYTLRKNQRTTKSVSSQVSINTITEGGKQASTITKETNSWNPIAWLFSIFTILFNSKSSELEQPSKQRVRILKKRNATIKYTQRETRTPTR